MADIFVSYSRADVQRVRPLLQALERHGWSVWWDEHIPAGPHYSAYIESVIARCRTMLVLWSEHSVPSEWVLAEADEGRKRFGQNLVPAQLDNVEPPLIFRPRQHVGLVDWNGSAQHPSFFALVGALERILGLPDRASKIAEPYTVCLPAEGRFQPTTTVGTRVREGSAVGTLDVAGMKRLVLLSPRAGTVRDIARAGLMDRGAPVVRLNSEVIPSPSDGTVRFAGPAGNLPSEAYFQVGDIVCYIEVFQTLVSVESPSVGRGFALEQAGVTVDKGDPVFEVVPDLARSVAALFGGSQAVDAPSAAEQPPSTDRFEIRSPMVGTFYSRPAPDAPPYVEIGAEVESGDTVCLIEAMKLMNEVAVERAGKIVEICVRDGQPIEYDQRLFVLTP